MSIYALVQKFTLAALLSAVVPSACAMAAPVCPWDDAEKLVVDTRMKWVEVNGASYDVAGLRDRKDFISTLNACGMHESTKSFRRWRLARRWVNGLAAPSIVLISPIGFVGMGVAGGFAGGYSAELTRDMEREWSERTVVGVAVETDVIGGAVGVPAPSGLNAQRAASAQP